ncbi:LutC/YkgG family protein [Bacillus badius]|nr:lactate utilization protein C [Bacillus badius]KZO01109.1 lactate utilization protein C [Bacillus badius]MED4717582.1 lactate utilization protein C [Bacillus badius]OCS89157.1 lactate utilization protein C [Bacillus badius]OVE50923.1 lactate utilization protein C [Bacillus badius]
MAAGQMHNRDSFLNDLAKSFGRERRRQVKKPEWTYRPQWDVLKGASQDELAEALKKQCSLIHTDVYETAASELGGLVKDLVQQYGGQSVVMWDDPRMDEFGLSSLPDELTKEQVAVHIWDSGKREENLSFSSTADIGITFSDAALAESGTVVLYNGKEKGRAVSLLPAIYFAIIPKSVIVPRMTQVAKQLHLKIEAGELVPSCVNFISGPSNSADIEMNLIVGVHGPVKAAYILVDDK